MNGFTRVATCVPALQVANPAFNAGEIRSLYLEADARSAALVLFPELSITGYSCGDLFEQNILLNAAEKAVADLTRATIGRRSVLVVGTPVRIGSRLFNAAAVIANGSILGMPFKEYLPNYREFYEKRQFRSGREFSGNTISYAGQDNIPAGLGLVFQSPDGGPRFGVEICEDLWAVTPPSSNLALGGAEIILNLSAGNELVAKANYRRTLVAGQSARLSAVYLLAGAGVHESTSDVVFSGHALIAFNGTILGENNRFERKGSSVYADVNANWCRALRASWTSFHDSPVPSSIRYVRAPVLPPAPNLDCLALSETPFVPADPATKECRCREIFSIQAAGLAKRIEVTNAKRLVIGISGGLDSTLALLACAHTTDLLGLPRKFTLAVTMPGFGTTSRTRSNASALAEKLGAELREISICKSVEQHFTDIGHNPENHSVVYENAQARERTQILMDLANAEAGLLVGTGDLSEIALGWSTYNGDHMSMYNVNCGIPKSLIRYLCAYEASVSDAETAKILIDINDTPVSPELLPGPQKTESILGRYELHDFFLYYFLKYGETPENLLALARRAFPESIPSEAIDEALRVFMRRFATQQFKRNACPDGPKVGTMALSPRGDWRCPSDYSPSLWISP